MDIAKQKERMRIYVYRNDEANDLARVVLPIMAIVLQSERKIRQQELLLKMKSIFWYMP